MDKRSQNFLYKLLETPSPTGFEQEIQKVVRAHMKDVADTMETDLHGNLIVGLNPKAKRRVMLAGHCDQIGLMVKHIDKDGFLWSSALGGIDVGVLIGAQVTVHTKKGPINGIVGRKPIHLQNGEERSKMSLDLENVWIDIGSKNQKESEKRVEIGDPVTFKLGVLELGNQMICAPGLDDKAGLYIAMEALRLCAKAKLAVGVYAVSTVQEEVGLRGARTAAFSVDPEVGIAIDVTHSSDNPGAGSGKSTPCKLGKGPTIARGPNFNPVVGEMLVAAAKKAKIPYQPATAAGPLGNDANAIQVSRGGVAASAIGIPNRYMHTQVEVCSLDDLDNSAKLLAAFIKSIKPTTDFRP
ncbi:MAG: M42 family metallopeptidase [Oligoflexia bacterium]|nr:M42 family metallopeptidase [Oligoflexia bacterium]